MKKTKIIFWIATSFLFAFEGLMPLSTVVFAPDYVNAGTKPLGYPDYFAYTLIFFKIAGATTLMIPRLPSAIKEWAYAGLAFNLLFAFISHAVVDQHIPYILMPVIIGAILAVSYICHGKLNQHG